MNHALYNNKLKKIKIRIAVSLPSRLDECGLNIITYKFEKVKI